MISHVIKPKGARLYSARVRLDHETKITQIPLHCTNRQVAEKKLRDLVEEREREAAGIIAPKVQREAAQTSLVIHLDEMIASKESSRDSMYLCNLKSRVRRLVAECRWTLAKDITPESFQEWCSRQTLSRKALNDYLTSARTLLNWMQKRNRITFNPLRSLDLLPADEEKRRPRRALSDEELAALFTASGERGVAYSTSATTGIRLGELLEVELRDIRLEEAEPRIVARAATTKNRKEASLHLHPEVAAQLRAFLATRKIGPDEKVFAPFLSKRGQFKRDLEAAGIAPVDEKGRVVDFHSLRHTFCTNLQRLGTPQRVLMHLMRHSDRRLSDHIYTDTSLLPASEAVQKLTVPSKKLSQIPSHDLVPAGQTGSHAVTTTNPVECPAMPINACLGHDQTSPVTTGHNGGMVRATGFEPVTSCV